MALFEFTEEFRDALHSLPPDIQEDIKKKLGFYASCQNPFLYAKKLKGMKNIYRFRIGDYRAAFYVECLTFIFLAVKNRKDVYRGFSL